MGLGRARGCPESPPRGGERFGRRGEPRASAPPWSAARSCAPLERGSRRPRGSEPRDARGRRTSVLAHDLKSPPPTDTGWGGSPNAPPSSRARTTSRRTPRRAAGPPWSGRGGSDDGGASCFTSGWAAPWCTTFYASAAAALQRDTIQRPWVASMTVAPHDKIPHRMAGYQIEKIDGKEGFGSGDGHLWRALSRRHDHRFAKFLLHLKHLLINGPSCSEMYRSAETSSFARDDVVGRRRGAASGVQGGRRYYTLSAAGRNRGDERAV